MEGASPLGFIEVLARLPVSTVVFAMGFFLLIRLVAARIEGRAARFFSDLMDAVIYAGILVYLIVRPFIAQPFYIPSGSMLDTLKIGDLVMVGKFNYRFSDPKQGDIIVFRAPDHALEQGQIPGKTDFIKRLIGKPGDIIEIKPNDGVYRNNEKLKEDYARSNANYSMGMKIIGGSVYNLYEGFNGEISVFRAPNNLNEKAEVPRGVPGIQVDDDEAERVIKAKPEPIPEGKYLALGDNRNESSDGRFWGLLDSNRVVGKALFVFWRNPFKKDEPEY